MAKFKVGDKIVFGRGKRNQDLNKITVGRIYAVQVLPSGDYVYDDSGAYYRFSAENGKPTKIVD